MSAAGKTLALLCATLAWQQQPGHVGPHQPDVPAPRIFWAARTHAQIDHAVHEVRLVCVALARPNLQQQQQQHTLL